MSLGQELKIGGGKQRESNIEALRLLCMLMVLNLHSFHGYTYGSGVLQFLDFFRESTSICAVNVFVLISGYFGIRWKLKSFYNLLFQCLFYSFGVYLVAVALGGVSFNTQSLTKCFNYPFIGWGFITNYIVLYILSPVLNAFAEKCHSKDLFIFVVSLFLADIVLLIVNENSLCITTNLLNFLLLYLLGRLINKTNMVSFSAKQPWNQYIICTIIITLLVYLTYKFTPIRTAKLMTQFPFGYSYGSPFVIIQAILLFLCFARMRFTSKIINWAASSCLAIFLIHMHPAIKRIGYYKITDEFYSLPFWQHLAYLTILILGVFCGSIIIDKIRILISEIVYELMRKFKALIPAKFLTLDTYIPKRFQNIL